MITKNEISSLNLSPTKKDFVQIWNELIEVASKITERWDPTSTNESDPGIVLIKVLAGIADKLNYNIDKNILEAYMPTAAQMESMRKLCELMGYDIKYYQSAETTVRISYTGNTTDLSDENDEKLPEPSGLALPKFTTITNADKDITFVTTNAIPVLIQNSKPWVEVPCIEGQLSQCETMNDHNLITLAQLDDNNRYYLPEIQIAENGIFVYNAITSSSTAEVSDGELWTRVSNLNTQSADTRVFKFGYDSFEGRPYLAFPDDIGSLIGDGLLIYFIRTSGLSGNISPRTLDTLEIPAGDSWSKYSAEQFEVVNVNATTNGANIESISSAYENFKKTVGTFDTLVTCRDYMNKIYTLMDANNSPYVSNILVTDIRSDINNAITLCSCNEFGILYKETPLTETVHMGSSVRTVKTNNSSNIYKLIVTQDPDSTNEKPLIDHFDLLLYPFKTFTQVSYGTKDLVGNYNKSFTYTETMYNEIDAALADLKTCAHNLILPDEGDIITINNYLRLNALIATAVRVTEAEANDILKNVKVALVNEFNLRNLDFGEEIPFDSILSVIENADSRIKVVSLQEPAVLTTYSVKKEETDGTISKATSKEFGIASAADIEADISNETYDNTIYGVTYKEVLDELDENGENKVVYCKTAKEIYNKLVLRNILAGRASLFDYDETFESSNSEKPYTITKRLTNNEFEISDELKAMYPSAGEFVINQVGPNGGVLTLFVSTINGENVYEVYETTEPLHDQANISDISRIEAVCEISSTSNTFENITLAKNEVIKFRAPNLITTKTFPAYVYYRYEKATGTQSGKDGTDAKAGRYATAIKLADFILDVKPENFFKKLFEEAEKAGEELNTLVAEYSNGKTIIPQPELLPSIFNSAIAVVSDTELVSGHSTTYGSEGDLRKDLDAFFTKEDDNKNLINKDKQVKLKYYQLIQGTIETWSDCVRSFNKNLPKGTTLWRLSSTSNYPMGKLVINTSQRLFAQSSEYLLNSRVSSVTYICTDLGADAENYTIAENSDVELGENDKLYIHYTPASTNEDGETVTAEPISIVYTGSKDEPIILKPSGFSLIPSEEVYRQGTSWKKTDVDFGTHGKQNLLALGANEQIELRSISRVVLDAPARFYKNFDDIGLEQGDSSGPYEYELKDGEYLFYTDQNTQAAAYYGSGSVITLDPGAHIPRTSDENKVEPSQILEHGMHIVPWSSHVSLNKDKKITITEYQYITLVEGDTLNTLMLAAETGDPTADSSYTLSNSESKWAKCDMGHPITYTTANAENATTLPKISLSSADSHTGWEVRSLLELSTAPGYAQPLRAVETTGNEDPTTVTIMNKINIYQNTATGATSEPIEIAPRKTVVPGSGGKELYETVSVKLNTIARVASGNLNYIKSDDTENNTKLQMKVFKEESPAILTLNNSDEITTPISRKSSLPIEKTSDSINNYWTKVDIISSLLKTNDLPIVKALNLNFMIPENSDVFGIFSLYLEVPEDRLDPSSKQGIPKSEVKLDEDGNDIGAKCRVFIDIPKEFGTSYEDVINIFNYEKADNNGKQQHWWTEGVDEKNSNRLYLRAGLNCIIVKKSCNLLIKAEKNAAGNILYDNMRLVKGTATHGINLDLIDFNVASITDPISNNMSDEDKSQKKKQLAEDLLEIISELDKNYEFYYNVPIENSLAMEFDKNISSFSNPYTLYDINNINNNFVISKLDVKYLDTGLKIAKSSRY
jgi:hypothetical protein